MSDYIKREDAIQAIVGHLVPKQYDGNLVNAGFEVAHEIVDVLPSADVVEVVRCKDCKYKVVTKEGEYNPEDIVCDYWQSDGLTENDFCSQGKEQDDASKTMRHMQEDNSR